MDWEGLGTKHLSPITHPLVSGWGRLRFCKLTCHQTGIWLWECSLWKKSISGRWKVFYWHALYRHGEQQVLSHISCQKWYSILNCAVTKNTILTNPSCQVRRLSKLKPACLIHLYSFLCSATRRVPSFVDVWLCYAHICTFLPLLTQNHWHSIG